MRKKIIVLGIIIAVIVCSVFFATKNSKSPNKEIVKKTSVVSKKSNSSTMKGTELEPVYSLVKTLFYKQGTYKEYANIFTNPKNALTEKAFEDYRKNNDATTYFKYDPGTPESVMKHMKVVTEKDTTKVYYLKDINSTEETKTAQYWQVTKVNGVWKIKN